MNLQQLESILGEPIPRGRLVAGFEPDNPSLCYGREDKLINPDASTQAPKPPISEDFSHLNPVRRMKAYGWDVVVLTTSGERKTLRYTGNEAKARGRARRRPDVAEILDMQPFNHNHAA